MKEQLLHTPEGVRDIYNAECIKKLRIQNSLLECIHLYGFQEIQTPTFEFFDIFSRERGTVAAKDMYRFFDREGNTLALRPDMTPPIARCVAKYFREEELPIRLMYCGNTYINNESFQGKLKEITQLGAELINDSSAEADAEMVAMTVDCLLTAGLEEFQVEIGHAEFFSGLAEEAGLREEETERLRELIENKNLFGIEELLASKKLGSSLKSLLCRLPQLFGAPENIRDVKREVTSMRAKAALDRLDEVYELLKVYGFEKYITYDLGMLSKYNYYTGIIFRAFTHGTGDAVANGGRYDSLVGQFGKDAPAIGAAISLDQLLAALSRQKLLAEPESEDTLIVYRKSAVQTAVGLARHFRKEGLRVELFAEQEERPLEEYAAYARRMGLGGILYLNGGTEVQVVCAADGSIQTAPLTGLFK